MMEPSTRGGLFLTGVSGFIGRRLIEALAHTPFAHIDCLIRDPLKLPPSVVRHKRLNIIQGVLDKPADYFSNLQRCETVIHLAAATGKAPREEYFKVNTEGTRILVEESCRAGVKHFLYVSTIAAKFQDKHQYYYGQSKEQAEEAVKKSGIPFTIVRPTLVIGENGNACKSLLKLGRVPLLSVLGKGTTKIQPIYVDDLIDCLKEVIEKRIFQDQTLELGGPEVLTIEEFLRRVYHAYHHKEPRQVVHIPLGMVRVLLNLIEGVVGSRLPFTVGQLASFANDGIIKESRLFREFRPHMKTIDQMISLATNHG